MTDALVRLLLAGRPAIAAFESLDEVGLVSKLLPEWEHVRHYHQRNAYHRFTVDRHLLETAANASALAPEVQRPDLLVIGALLHDIGKGLPGDHTAVGIEIVASLGPRLGFDFDDVVVLCSLVRHHLLLADTATRRDLSDPVTIDRVAEEVGDRTTLQLLAALTKADSLATGSSAWGSWKEQLVNELVEKVDAQLEGAGPVARPAEPQLAHDELVASVLTSGEPELRIDAPSVLIAAPDRPGLLADVAGTLALNGLDVHAANAWSVGGVALDTFTVEPASGRWPEPVTLRADLLGVLRGDIDLTEELRRRSAAYASARRTWSAHPVIVSVAVDNDASLESTVIEIRAADEIGLLRRLTTCLFDCGLDVAAARVATIGGEVVDAFYVRDRAGAKIDDPAVLAVVTEQLRAVLRGSGGETGS
jgi:[protein-PII] uridylyltransferase